MKVNKFLSSKSSHQRRQTWEEGWCRRAWWICCGWERIAEWGTTSGTAGLPTNSESDQILHIWETFEKCYASEISMSFQYWIRYNNGRNLWRILMDSLTFCISLISIYILTTILEVYHRFYTVMFFLVGSSIHHIRNVRLSSMFQYTRLRWQPVTERFFLRDCIHRFE